MKEIPTQVENSIKIITAFAERYANDSSNSDSLNLIIAYEGLSTAMDWTEEVLSRENLDDDIKKREISFLKEAKSALEILHTNYSWLPSFIDEYREMYRVRIEEILQ